MPGPTSLLNTVSLSEFTDLVEKKFVQTQQMVQEVARKLYIYQDMAEHTGNTRRFDEVDTETYGNLKPEGVNATLAKVGVGYNVTMTSKRIAKEIQITWEMRRYNKEPEVIGMLTSLGHFGPQRMELDLSHRFTFGAAASYVDLDGVSQNIAGGDGLSIINTAHTLKFSASTWSNRVTGDPAFSRGALEAAEALTNTDILSNFGERRVIKFNTIISTDDPSTVNTIREFLESTASPAAANSGVVNVYHAKYDHVQLDYMATNALGQRDSTKRRWWGLMAAGQSIAGWQAYLGVWETPHLITPEIGNNAEDAHNDNWTYGTRCSYGIVALSGRGLIMSMPVS